MDQIEVTSFTSKGPSGKGGPVLSKPRKLIFMGLFSLFSMAAWAGGPPFYFTIGVDPTFASPVAIGMSNAEEVQTRLKVSSTDGKSTRYLKASLNKTDKNTFADLSTGMTYSCQFEGLAPGRLAKLCVLLMGQYQAYFWVWQDPEGAGHPVYILDSGESGGYGPVNFSYQAQGPVNYAITIKKILTNRRSCL